MASIDSVARVRTPLVAMLALSPSLFACGSAPPSPAPPVASHDRDPWFGGSTEDEPWTETHRETLRVGGTDYVLSMRAWEGEGEALVVVGPDGSARGAYRFAFGGNGGTLSIAERCVTPDWVVLELRAEGEARGFRLDPGQGDCPQSIDAARQQAIDDGTEDDPCEVPPSCEVSFAEIGIDATHVWLVSAASSDAPERACYASAPDAADPR